LTVSSVLPAYLQHVERHNRGGKILARQCAALLATWQHRALSDITADDCFRLIQQTKTSGMGLKMHKAQSESRPRLAHSSLSGFFSWCVRQRHLATSPMRGLARPPAAQARDRVLDDGELRLFWRATGALSPWHSACLRLLLLTGARLNEIAQLRIEEVQGDAIALPASRVKNKRPHVVPLSSLALEILAAVPKIEGSPFVFSSGHRPVGGWHRVKVQLDAEMRALGWSGAPWRVHDLRRTCATGLAKLGVPIHVTEKVLNHASGSISGVAAVYNRHSYAVEMRDALERWSCEVAKIVGENVVQLAARG
jgi:integrase